MPLGSKAASDPVFFSIVSSITAPLLMFIKSNFSGMINLVFVWDFIEYVVELLVAELDGWIDGHHCGCHLVPVKPAIVFSIKSGETLHIFSVYSKPTSIWQFPTSWILFSFSAKSQSCAGPRRTVIAMGED